MADSATSSAVAEPAATQNVSLDGDFVTSTEPLVTFEVFYRMPAKQLEDETGAPIAFRVTGDFFNKNVALSCRPDKQKLGPWIVLCRMDDARVYEEKISSGKNLPPLWWKVIMRLPAKGGDVWGGTKRRIY